MSDLIVSNSTVTTPVPIAPISTRLATMDDIPFMDGLMKQYNRQLGFFPRAQLQGYVDGQWVLIAQDAATGERLGFCASRDRYLKRDELGVIYLLCVVPGNQRKLIGASLIKAVFERSAYGCRLYCCWCAQDIAANYFWESLGFVPIAFRAGSSGKKRVHIFWQRRINEGDAATNYWYPFQTSQGAIRQDRLVFPIPPGVRWQDVTAVAEAGSKDEGRRLKDERKAKKPSGPPSSFIPQPSSLPTKVAIFVRGKIKYVDRPCGVPVTPPATAVAAKPATVKRVKTPAPKIDPTFLVKARELRDRYLEEVNNGRHRPAAANGKYDVSRAIVGAASDAGHHVAAALLPTTPTRLLEAA
jgi:GNAT superfamily N-acetyltransferase